MATLVAPADTPESFCGDSGTRAGGMASPPAASAHHFDDARFYLLVVVGELVSPEHLKCAIADIEKGEAALFHPSERFLYPCYLKSHSALYGTGAAPSRH